MRQIAKNAITKFCRLISDKRFFLQISGQALSVIVTFSLDKVLIVSIIAAVS